MRKWLIMLGAVLITLPASVNAGTASGLWTFDSDPGFTTSTGGGSDTNFQWSIAGGMLNMAMTREAKAQRVYMALPENFGNTDMFQMKARFNIVNNDGASVFLGFFDKDSATNISNGGDHINLEFYNRISFPGGYGANHYDHGSTTIPTGTWYTVYMSFKATDDTYTQSIYDDSGNLLETITPGTAGVNNGVDAIGFTNYNESQNSTVESVQFDWVTWSVNTDLPVIPEPATMALLGLGGLFMARRRK